MKTAQQQIELLYKRMLANKADPRAVKHVFKIKQRYESEVARAAHLYVISRKNLK